MGVNVLTCVAATRRAGWLLAVCGMTVGAIGAASVVAAPAAADPAASGVTSVQAAAARVPVKVFVVNLFGMEAAPWLAALKPQREFRVPGLSEDYPLVRCAADAVCQMTTGMGHANAAASVMAVLYSGVFDLRRTYWLVNGIAGIDPARGTIGSAAWARYVVDGGITQEIDARDRPSGWRDGFFGVMTDSPDQLPKLEYRTELFRLDEALLQKAFELSKTAKLEDSPDLEAYRRHYPHAPANQPPSVIQCDTFSSDTWWSGVRLGERARAWTGVLTQGKGDYCTSQQEDNAVLNALTRGGQSGLADIRRVAVLRSGSDFDRPFPHQSALQSLQAQRALEAAVRVSAANLVNAGMPLVRAIVQHWDQWRDGVPTTAP